MTYLKKEDIFFERDGEGNVLPVEITLETLEGKPMIKATPLSKGELAEVVSSSTGNETNIDTDVDIIIKHCKEPSFSEEDRESLKKAAKSTFTNAIALAILSVSTGMDQNKILEEGKKKIVETELRNFPKQ